MNDTLSIEQQLHIDHLPQDQQQTILNQMLPLLMQSVMTRSMVSLSDEDTQEFTNGNISNPNELLTFLALKVPDFETIWDEEIRATSSDIAMMIG